MNEFDQFVLDHIVSLTPTEVRAHYPGLRGSVKEQVDAAGALAKAGYEGAAQLLRVMLPGVGPSAAAAFRVAIERLDPSASDATPDPTGLNRRAASWFLRHASASTRVSAALAVMKTALRPGDKALLSGRGATAECKARAAEIIAPGLSVDLLADLVHAMTGNEELAAACLVLERQLIICGARLPALDDPNEVRAEAAVRMLNATHLQNQKTVEVLLRHARASRTSNLRTAAREALLAHEPKLCLPLMPELLIDPDVVGAAIDVVSQQAPGDPAADLMVDALPRADARCGEALLNALWSIPSRRVAALEAAAAARDVRLRQIVLNRLSPWESDDHLRILRQLCDDANARLRGEARKRLGAVQPDEARRLWLADLKRYPAQALDAIKDETPTPQELRGVLGTLRTLCRSTESGVRLRARVLAQRWVPAAARRLLASGLRDPDPRRRSEAAALAGKCPDPLIVDELLPLARDSDGKTRRSAIVALANFDDPRVLSELVSSLSDTLELVRTSARKLLKSGPERVPALARHPPGADGVPVWKRMRRDIREVARFARAAGAELLGRDVIMHPYRHGLGVTKKPEKGGPVEIAVSDTPVTSNHPHGVEIMKALVLHELGHHVYDIGVRGASSHRGKARTEGLGLVFNLLADERLERGLRSRKPAWGRHFDRLASYAFAQNKHRVPLKDLARLLDQEPDQVTKAITRGTLPGKLSGPTARHAGPHVILTDADMLSIPSLLPRMVAFMACLRCGFDPRLCPDPRIAKAIACVPPNLKDVDHAGLLDVARKVGRWIGDAAAQKRELAKFHKKIKLHRRAMSALRKLLERLAETGQLELVPAAGTPGIRTSGPWDDDDEPASGTTAGRREQPGLSTPPRLPGVPRLKLRPGPRAGRGVARAREPSRPRHGAGGTDFNTQPGTAFPPLTRTVTLNYDAEAHARVVATIRPHIRRLRSFLEQLGRREVESFAQRRGHRLDLAEVRRLARGLRLGLMVGTETLPPPDLYLGLLIDRSGSMEGEKIKRAIAFGVLLAEAAKGVRGITGHVSAFDGQTFYQAGTFRRNAIARLTADDGNNDAGALQRAVELALQSRKRRAAIVMVSDGCPSECTFESLKQLVTHVTNDRGIVCVQVAVTPLLAVAFPEYVDLSQYSLTGSVTLFGRMLVRLISACT